MGAVPPVPTSASSCASHGPGGPVDPVDTVAGADVDFGQRPQGSARSRHDRLPTPALVVAGVLAMLALLMLARAIALLPGIDARWQLGPAGELWLVASHDPALAALAGTRLLAVEASGRALPADPAWLHSAPRWRADEQARRALVQSRRALAELLRAPSVTLRMDDGRTARIDPRTRNHALAGPAFWLLALPALGLSLLGVRALASPRRAPLRLFAVVAIAQGLSLLALGTDLEHGLVALPGWWADDLPWRGALDLASAAAALHLVALHPLRLRRAAAIAAAGWALAALAVAAAFGASAATAAGAAPWPAWWVVQAAMLSLVAGACAVLARSQRLLPHPFSAVLLRLLVVVGATLAVLSAALAVAGAGAALQGPALLAVLAWSLFAASLTVWVPFLVRGRPLLPEVGLVTGLAALTASLHLGLAARAGLDAPVAALAAAALALGAYALARRWLAGPLTGRGALPAERAFEHLVTVARELVDHPDRHEALLGRLLRELFDPLELHPQARALPEARVTDGGTALAVPVRTGDDAAPLLLLLRFARRGQRLFTIGDATLADRIAEQLRRAAAYEMAVEHGRSQERHRIAQDLHDDIGARLLTLMYRAQDPQVESYLRHTLQDLKTLTRGLAAREHRLSHAAAEWKADLQHRLEAAQVDLDWSFDHGTDPVLGMGQWSALTRILRELATNAMAHARATRLEVSATLHGGTLALRVADDGCGRAPETWAPGLGLGGVRKRVRQLGGRVRWHEGTPSGIVCEVELPLAPPP